MTTFKQFITEADSAFDIEQFKIDCAYLFEQLAGSQGEKMLYHGGASTSKDWEIRQFKERTKPRNSPTALHAALNTFFTEKFGAPARNWLFATGNISTATLYVARRSDALHAIFPIGKFDWICGVDKEFRDLTTLHTSLSSKIWATSGKKDIAGANRRGVDAVIDTLRKGEWNHNTNLPECIASGNEIVIKCDKFYAIKINSPTFNTAIKPFLDTL